VPKDEVDRRVREALALVDLEGFEQRKPPQMSGGQQQRVALARALVNRPKVLLLDEPLGALDLKLREQMQVELKAIQREVGITFLFVTHDQEEALTMSDRIAVFNQGRIEQVGTPAEIYGSPATPFVAQFVGTMNRVESIVSLTEPGKVMADGAQLEVEAARGRRPGERVLLLVRPETVELQAAASDGGHVGSVVSHTFLGSVTRVRVEAGDSEWTADLSGERAAALPVDSRVAIRFPAASAKLLSLEDAEPLEAVPDDL
jgi:putative spermidine/putrescine transport system ATP-binding protein